MPVSVLCTTALLELVMAAVVTLAVGAVVSELVVVLSDVLLSVVNPLDVSVSY